LAILTASLALNGCSDSSPSGPTTNRSFLVDAEGGGDFLTIQQGLNAAIDGDTVFVAPGTYAGVGNRNLLFHGASVVLTGLGERDEVVIDCEGAGRGFYIDGDESPVIGNLMITGGDTIRGGGMYLEGASPVLWNVRFVANASSDGGGGIYCRNGSPVLTDVLLDDNSSWVEGAGMLCNHASPTLSNVVFVRNSTYGSGGGLACLFSSPVLSGCTFRDNRAIFGGGIYCGESSPDITSCTFVENRGDIGSSVYCFDNSSPSITQTILAFGVPGEALYCEDMNSSPLTNFCCVYENGELNELCGTYTTSMIYLDPLFCDLESGDLTLRSASECLPSNNIWGLQIGAFGEGCP
jgi:predicted outer membrane repeat protein